MFGKIGFNFLNLLFFSFLIIFGFSISSGTSCQGSKSSTSKRSQSSSMTRIPGTKVFAEIPSEYVWNENKSGYRYGNSENYLLGMYFPVDFALMKKGWRQQVSIMPSMKMRSFQKNNLEVMIISGYSPREKYHSYMLMMETNYHPMMLVAKIRDTTLMAEMNVPAIIESLYHDDDFDLDIFEFQNYKFDKEISGFHYYYYSLPGKNSRADYLRDPIKDMDNLGPERISVFYRKKMTEEEIDKRLKNARSSVDSKNLIDYNRTNTVINGLDVSYMEIDAEYDGKPSYTIFAIIRGKEEYYAFRAMTNRDVEEMKEKYLATLKSFKVK